MLFDAMITGDFKPFIGVHTTGSYTLYVNKMSAFWARCTDNRIMEIAVKKTNLDTITALISSSYDIRRRINAIV